MAKKWVGDKISEMAERVGNKWQLRQQPAALPAAQAASAAAPGATVLLAEATPAPAAVQPSGPLDRMFKAQSAAMPTPAVPSALRALGPASLLKAPERLVTTTAAGEAQEPAAVPATAATSAALSVLEVPQGVTGTGDAFWLDVVRHIEADGEVDGAPTFGSVFNGAALARLLDALPAFVLSVLLAALGRALEARPAAAARICSYLCNVVQALAAREATGKEMTLSQQAWADRLAQPAAVSLGELFEEPELPSMLTRCIQRADSRADGMAILEVLAAADAGKAALDRAEEEGKAALRKALEASAGSEHAAAAGRVLNMLRNS